MATTFDLGGRIALVTGASSGLGTRFARMLADNGAHVVLAARRIERLQALRNEIVAAGGHATAVALDVTDVGSIRAAVAQAEEEAGPIDILINNSGVSTTQRIVDVTPEDYDFVLNTNTRGAFFVAQEVGKRMIERARTQPGRPARIINVASLAALKVLPMIGIYCISKAAVTQMTRAMAIEWGRYGINVNAICPGYISTELNEHHWDTEGGKKLIAMTPRKRLGQPEDLDGIVLLLASERSGFVNGSVINVDDGFSL
ncbi:MAG: SDR family oxidoreductase [Betaproteobacteria bacterium]|nr:SDR family oxidoreductase [Betaproteobacteria bacterium]